MWKMKRSARFLGASVTSALVALSIGGAATNAQAVSPTAASVARSASVQSDQVSIMTGWLTIEMWGPANDITRLRCLARKAQVEKAHVGHAFRCTVQDKTMVLQALIVVR